MPQNEASRYEIFSITEYSKNGEKKSYWLRIGAGFRNRDDSFGLVFQALPLPDPKSGLLRLYMRPFRDTTGMDEPFSLDIDGLVGASLEEQQ